MVTPKEKTGHPLRIYWAGLIAIFLVFLIAAGSCNLKNNAHSGRLPDGRLIGTVNHRSNMPFDSNQVASFYGSYPELNKYRKDLLEVYRQNRFMHIWYDSGGIVEFGQTLYSKIRELVVEGVSSKFPYQEKIDGVFENEKDNNLSQTETELMLTNLYLFYAEKVYKGLADTTTTAIGWLLPRKQVSFAALLDSVLPDRELFKRNDSVLFSQYYKLRDVLQQYREIEKKGGWKPIDAIPGKKGYKSGDTGRIILQVKERLLLTGELKHNNGSNLFDNDLMEAVKKFQARNGKTSTGMIGAELVREMNRPVGERISQIIVNMERCRWISPEFAKAKEFIVVNIPSFKLTFVRNGKTELESPVIVGSDVTKTVIFSGMLSYIVFSPYWNLPQSIISKEVRPGMAKNKNYLEKHNMEWNNGQVRQKPGKNNSLGLVKFIFPNSNDIYMHDTPAKSLFARETRAFSHGCIRVGKPRDLALTVLNDDPAWTTKRIDAAMRSGKEYTCVIKHKIPVYIGYFTAWVDRQGNLNFYNDIYQRDNRLASLLKEDK